MGIAQKGFQHKSITKFFTSMTYHTAFYWLNWKSGSINGMLFLHTLDSDTLERMIHFSENKHIQTLLKLAASVLSKVGLCKKIYIPISKIDQLNEESYLENEIPNIVQHKNGLNFKLGNIEINQDDFIQVNIISKEDWGTINWK